MVKKAIALLLALVMVFALCSCGQQAAPAAAAPAAEAPAAEAPAAEAPAAEAPAAEEPAAAEGKVLYGNQGPSEFFEIPWWNAGCYTYQKALFEPLIGMDENGMPTTREGMSESYELSEDGLTLTVKLRDGLKWHDGEPVTADDVVFCTEFANNELIQIQSQVKNFVNNVEEVTADGNAITFKFKAINANTLLGASLFHILPKHCLENADPAQFQQDQFWQAPIGSGPFKLDEVKMGEYTTLVPFEEYWGGVADYSIYLSVSAADSDPNLVTNAKAGRIDYAYTKSYADVQALEGVEGLTIVAVPILYDRLLRFNQFTHEEGKVSPFADARVRQAFAYAIDRATIAQQVFNGAVTPGEGTPTPPGDSWQEQGLNPYAYDPAKAKELLEEANFDFSKKYILAYYYTDQATVDLMAIIQAFLSQVGVSVEPKLLEGDLGTLLNGMPTDRHLDKGVSTVEWDLAYAGFAPSCNTEYYSYYHGETGIRNYAPIDDTVTALIDKMMGTTDVAVQKEAYSELEKFWNENMWEVALYHTPIWVILSDKVVDNFPAMGNPQFSWAWNMQNWTLK